MPLVQDAERIAISVILHTVFQRFVFCYLTVQFVNCNIHTVSVVYESSPRDILQPFVSVPCIGGSFLEMRCLRQEARDNNARGLQYRRKEVSVF